MHRPWQLYCAFAALLVACGNAKEADLYAGSKGVEGSGGGSFIPEGGNTASAGSPVSGSHSAGATLGSGGNVSGSGGSSTPGTVTGGAVSGDASNGVGGDSSEGQGGGHDGGGMDASGGNQPASGGRTMSGGRPGGGNAATGGGQAMGGTIASGGTASGGTSGAAGSGGSADPDETTCFQARQNTDAALEAAQACELDFEEQCVGMVEGECCPVPVNDPASKEAQAYLAALAKMKKVCGPSVCPAVLCVESEPSCELRGLASGRCVSRGGIGF